MSFGAEEKSRRQHLHQLLQERLPQLGLDADMYGPYVWGDEDETDDDDRDGDELREIVLGVLQASSETHADDDDVWIELIEIIQNANKLDSQLRREGREKHLLETKTKMEEDLARAKMEDVTAVANEEKKKSSQVDDEQKRILMQRYGYDVPDQDEDQGSGFGANSSGSKKSSSSSLAAAANAPTAPTNNRDVAKAAYQEKSKELRGAQKTTKAEERKKTKEQRTNKAQLKEGRRKRATKGERKA
jgi:hypothetical protein